MTTSILHATLKENFGFEKFRPNQEYIINCILYGQDTLAIMPTRVGKSICFIKPIIEFQKNKMLRAKADGSTYLETLALFQARLTVDEIAVKRSLGVSTINSHLAKLYVDGHLIDLSSYISKNEIAKIAEAKIKLESPNALKPYFDYFEEQMAYNKIRIGLAMVEKESKNKNTTLALIYKGKKAYKFGK